MMEHPAFGMEVVIVRWDVHIKAVVAFVCVSMIHFAVDALSCHRRQFKLVDTLICCETSLSWDMNISNPLWADVFSQMTP